MNLIESPQMIENFRVPRSKKRRIRKKWAKNPNNWRPMKKALQYGGTIIAHPSLAQKLREAMAENPATGIIAARMGIAGGIGKTVAPPLVYTPDPPRPVLSVNWSMVVNPKPLNVRIPLA